MPRKNAHKSHNGATLGFEETLWRAADKMRRHMDPSEYKHVALGLTFSQHDMDVVVGIPLQPGPRHGTASSAWSYIIAGPLQGGGKSDVCPHCGKEIRKT